MPRTATFADRLRSLRAAAGLTQDALADASGVELATIQALEQGRRVDPKLSTLIDLARGLGCGVEDLAA